MVACHSKPFEINQTWKFLEEIYNLLAFNNKGLDYNIYKFVSRPLFFIIIIPFKYPGSDVKIVNLVSIIQC